MMRAIVLLYSLAVISAWAPRPVAPNEHLGTSLKFRRGTAEEDLVAVQTNQRLDAMNDDEECEHQYFDRIGGDPLCWFGELEEVEHATRKLTRHLTSHPGHGELDEDCEDYYYDESGDALCWVIQS